MIVRYLFTRYYNCNFRIILRTILIKLNPKIQCNYGDHQHQWVKQTHNVKLWHFPQWLLSIYFQLIQKYELFCLMCLSWCFRRVLIYQTALVILLWYDDYLSEQFFFFFSVTKMYIGVIFVTTAPHISGHGSAHPKKFVFGVQTLFYFLLYVRVPLL